MQIYIYIYYRYTKNYSIARHDKSNNTNITFLCADIYEVVARKNLLVLIGNTVLEQEKKRANYSGKNRYYFILSSRFTK